MTAPNGGMENNREDLAQAIVNELQSWPALERDVFKQVHYQGRRTQDVAHSLGINVQDVNEILDDCEVRLRSALSVFRSAHADPQSESVHQLALFQLMSSSS
jgi:DNA-directed RNA polymerase specialized sigma24 family protein